MQELELSVIKSDRPKISAFAFSHHSTAILKCLMSKDGIVPYFDLRDEKHREIFECAIRNTDLFGADALEKMVEKVGVKPNSEPAESPKKMTHIYLMKNERNGLVKIGKSISPKFRERTLQSQEPEISMIFVSCLCEEIIEKDLHEKFSEKRVRGEWFNLTDDDILLITTKISQQ